MTGSKFGFTVEHINEDHEDWEAERTPGWKVCLPHRCGEWRIDDGFFSYEGTDQQAALAELDQFIAEAQQARAALARGDEYPPQKTRE